MPRHKRFALSAICDTVFAFDLSLDDRGAPVNIPRITFYDVSNEGMGSTSPA